MVQKVDERFLKVTKKKFPNLFKSCNYLSNFLPSFRPIATTATCSTNHQRHLYSFTFLIILISQLYRRLWFLIIWFQFGAVLQYFIIRNILQSIKMKIQDSYRRWICNASPHSLNILLVFKMR